MFKKWGSTFENPVAEIDENNAVYIPVHKYSPRHEYIGVDDWFSRKVKGIVSAAQIVKGVPGVLWFLQNINDNVTEVYAELSVLLRPDMDLSLLTDFIPAKLKHEQAFACVSCFQTKSEQETVIIHCETLSMSKLYVYEIEHPFKLVNEKIYLDAGPEQAISFLDRSSTKEN